MNQIAGRSLASQGFSLPPLRVAAPARDRVRADTVGASSNSYNYATPEPDVVNGGMGNYFEALRVSRDRSAIPFASVHLRPQILRLLNGLNRKMLAGIGRYLYDNNGMVSGPVDTIADYSTPVIPQAASEDLEWNVASESVFSEWSKRCDFTGRFSFEELQRIYCIAMDTDGDIGVTMDATLAGVPQLRTFDTLHIGTLTGLDPKDGVVIDDKTGFVDGYMVVDGPVETLQGIATKFVPSNQLLLLRDVDRFGNYRGFSPIRRGANDIRDMSDIKAFEKLGVKIGAALAAVIEQVGPIEEDVWGNDNGLNGNMPGAVQSDGTVNNPTPTPQEKKLSLAELLGGDIPTISGKMTQLNNSRPNATVTPFMEFLAGLYIIGLGMPRAFFLDDELTGPGIRMVLGKTQRKFNSRISTICKLVDFAWSRVIANAIISGELKPVKNWWKITYQMPRQISIDLGDEAQNDREDTARGQMTRQERYGKRGKDWTNEETQITNEDDYVIGQCVGLFEKYGGKVPLDILLSRRGFSPQPGAAAAPSLKESPKGSTTEKNKPPKEPEE